MNTYKSIVKELEELCAKQKKEIERLKNEILILQSDISRKADTINRMTEFSKLVNEKKTNISENKPNYESLYKELQDQQRLDCITIIQLRSALGVLCEEYGSLRKEKRGEKS